MLVALLLDIIYIIIFNLLSLIFGNFSDVSANSVFVAQIIAAQQALATWNVFLPLSTVFTCLTVIFVIELVIFLFKNVNFFRRLIPGQG